MKYNSILLLLVGLFYLQSCNKSEEISFDPIDTENLVELSREELNQIIVDKVKKKGEAIDWPELNDSEFASAFRLSENHLVLAAWDINSTDDKEKEVIIDYIFNNENPANNKEVIYEVNEKLNFLYARIEKVETLIGLRKLKATSHLDVFYSVITEKDLANADINQEKFNEALRGKSSDDCTTANGVVARDADVVCRQNISAAWAAGIDGDNIEIAVIDNGVIRDDPIFGEGKHYANRSIKRQSYYKRNWWWPWGGYDPPWARQNALGAMGHGTDMMKRAGCQNGSPENAGIAYMSDLIIIRGSNEFLLNLPSNIVGATRSFAAMANDNSVKIISMSQGAVFVTSTGLNRAIKDCYNNGKLIFTAAGTFPLGSIVDDLINQPDLTLYPSTLPEVHGVTGILPLPTDNINHAYWCELCFGIADFVVEFDLFKGSSSAATSSVAGMAALIWSTNPGMNRDDVYLKMRQSADRFNKSGRFGHGRLDLNEFVNEMQ